MINQDEFRLPSSFLPQTFSLIWCLISIWKLCWLFEMSSPPARMWYARYLCLEADIEISSSPSTTKKNLCILTTFFSCEHLCLMWFLGYILCLYPTTKCKLAHIFLRKKTLVLISGSNAVLMDVEMCCCLTHLLLELQSGRTAFFATWQEYRMHKKQDPDLYLPHNHLHIVWDH